MSHEARIHSQTPTDSCSPKGRIITGNTDMDGDELKRVGLWCPAFPNLIIDRQSVELIDYPPAETRRSIELYPLNVLTEGVEWLRGKKILDIGSGKSGLQEDLARRGITPSETQVVGLNVNQASAEHNLAREIPNTNVLGRAEALPFRDCSFDIVVANNSLPRWATSSGQIRSFFNEAKRVTDENGMLCITPLCVNAAYYDENDPKQYAIIDFVQMATRLDAVVEFCKSMLEDPLWKVVNIDDVIKFINNPSDDFDSRIIAVKLSKQD